MKSKKSSGWFVLYGDTHIEYSTFEDASHMLEVLMREGGNKSVKLLPKEEYLKLPNKKTKRGKNS